jgi:hypothetical protein
LSARRRSRTGPSYRSGRGCRRRKPGCSELEGEGRLRWPLTRWAWVGVCRDSAQGLWKGGRGLRRGASERFSGRLADRLGGSAAGSAGRWQPPAGAGLDIWPASPARYATGLGTDRWFESHTNASRSQGRLRRGDRQARAAVSYPASDADRSLPALAVSADPCLISQAGSGPRVRIRLDGSRSELCAITLWRVLLDLVRASSFKPG